MDLKECELKYRNLIAGADTMVPLSSGKLVPYVNLDNAATTPPFVSVLKSIIDFAPWYSSVHRGAGYKSRVSTDVFEMSRTAILDFFNADADEYSVIFVKNATEAINKLSNRLCDGIKKDIVLSTEMEHHSNDLPWRKNYMMDYIGIDRCGRLDVDDIEFKLRKYGGAVKLVTVSGASNVTGFINPYHEIAAIAHKYGAKIMVDGAQLVPHSKIDINGEKMDEKIDFIAFSAHKMYAPFGIGVLIGPTKYFKNGEPDYPGGGTVKMVTRDFVKWEDPPLKDEAGSPNLMGVVALKTAMDTLNVIGMKNVEEYEGWLTKYTLKKIMAIPGIKIYGDKFGSKDRLGIISFNLDNVYHGLLSEILSREAGIAVRSGCFCAQPYIQKLLELSSGQIEYYKKNPESPRPGMVRVSLGVYNNRQEIDRLVRALEIISSNSDYYSKKYSRLAQGYV